MTIKAEFRTFIDDLAASISANLRTSRRSPDAPLMNEACEILAIRRGWALNSPELRALLAGTRKRYIVAPPRFTPSAGPSAQASLAQIQRVIGSSVLRSADSAKLLLLSPLEVAILRERFGTLAIEEDIQHHLPRRPLISRVEPIAVPSSAGRSTTILVRGPRSGVAGARVILKPIQDRDDGYEGVTDAAGELRLTLRSTDARFAKILILPRTNYWSRVITEVSYAPTLTFDVMPLSHDGFDWGLRETGAPMRGERLGRGLRVAIIDSGVARHPSLCDVLHGGKNYILGEDENSWHKDEEGHGTHCAGIIAALAKQSSTWGYAPEVELYAYRIFGGPDGGGWAFDIAAAIRDAIRAGCDIINLSLASQALSGQVRKAIEEAAEAGVLCIAAAGNDGGPVAYPAKLPEVLAVSAIGKTEVFPQDSVHTDARSEALSGGWFLASFSNRGPEIDLSAPGVAITSTLPPEDFGAWDGTSMACPHVTGMAAVLLDVLVRDASPSSLPRSPGRAGLVIDRLLGSCKDLGMPRDHQGAGLPQMNRITSPALGSSTPMPRDRINEGGAPKMENSTPEARLTEKTDDSADGSIAETSPTVAPVWAARRPGTTLNVLVLAANPASARKLRIKEETRKIKRELRRSTAGASVHFRVCERASPERVARELMRFRPEIVHFIAHGSAFEGLLLEGEDGAARLLDAATSATIFRVLGGSVRAVVLNACSSRPHAAAIAAHVDCAIGMNMPIEDGAAVSFAATLFGAISEGHSIKDAFDLASALETSGGRPELVVREGVDAGAILLVKRRAPLSTLPRLLLLVFVLASIVVAAIALIR